MKKLIVISSLVLSSMFASMSCTARSFDIPPIHYTVSIVSNSFDYVALSKTKGLYSVEEQEQEKKRNSFWKLFALAITVLLVVLFL